MLATPSTTRKAGPLSFRGGGGLCVASPRAVSVIPQTKALEGKARNDLKVQEKLFKDKQKKEIELSTTINQR